MLAKPARARRLDCRGDVCRRVAAAQSSQLGRIEALRADAQAVDAGGAKTRQVAAVGRARVALERDLGVIGDAEGAIDGVQQPPDLLGASAATACRRRSRSSAVVGRLVGRS